MTMMGHTSFRTFASASVAQAEANSTRMTAEMIQLFVKKFYPTVVPIIVDSGEVNLIPTLAAI